MRGKFFIGLIVLLIAGLGVAWTQRTPLMAWWHVQQLTLANDENRDACLKAVASYHERAIAPLIAGLDSPEEAVCRNLEAGLHAVVADWHVDDPRAADAAERTFQSFSRCSTEGKKVALRFGTTLARCDDDRPMPGQLARTLFDLMATGESDDTLRPAALGLAGAIAERSAVGQWQTACRNLALKGLVDPNPATRVAAIQLVMRPPLRSDAEALEKVVPFLTDRDPQARRSALLTLGSNTEIVREEQLLPLLHDADADIRRLCELTLRSRGLSDDHVHLAKLISDPDPAVRLRVLPLLRSTNDLDADVWLRRLTLDIAPAVRAAAVRVASGEPSDDLRQRIGEMAQTDPSPTVREIARFYLDRNTVRKVGK